MGRHTNEEMATLGKKAIGSIATILGDKTYFMGDQPCGADATLFAFLMGAVCPVFKSQLRDTINSHANLRAYIDRMKQQYFPQLAQN